MTKQKRKRNHEIKMIAGCIFQRELKMDVQNTYNVRLLFS